MHATQKVREKSLCVLLGSTRNPKTVQKMVVCVKNRAHNPKTDEN